MAEAGPQPPALQLVLGTADLTAVAVPLLEQLRRLVGDQQAAAAGAPAALAEAEAAWWWLAVDVATHFTRWGSSSELAGVADLLSPVWGPRPADVCRLRRRVSWRQRWPAACCRSGSGCCDAPAAPLGPEASLLICMLGKAEDAEGLCDMLAFCELHQGAALVATWGKLLQTLAVPQSLSSLGEATDTPRTALSCGLVTCAGAVLTATGGPLVSAWHHSPAAAAAEATAPQLQLARLLSFALCEWLPPLACTAHEGVLALRTGQPNLKEMHAEAISFSYGAVMLWLPALAMRSGAELARATGEAVGDAAAEAPAASPAVGGWRQVLLREAGTVPLLGVACQWLLRGSAPNDNGWSQKPWNPVITSCCLLAAACPGEVRQAVLAAAAEAAAAASCRGGRGGCTGQAANGTALAAAASALARQAELWAAGGDEDGSALVRAVAAMPPGSAHAVLVRALASFPSEARALLRTCANPACDNLAGDSEAALPLRACGWCGGAWYCRKECLAAHWRWGQREACAGRGPMVAGVAGPGESAAASSAR
ncbi:hypothetical protein TSOC_010127 [Tetrabaena socialis]|uniref:MYND-type domain-containing protein n=1 Tax=Tetrabaena socialis TaxID=47790 RepID=A0A2J7ZU48_9CHLO|nr:hypothetical protein TSOC_010127 [Tetrabaena socialis]|eukprot:PNH03789.1 hypothetical protein TSOC_010127 [Tetrabaena socialis]